MKQKITYSNRLNIKLALGKGLSYRKMGKKLGLNYTTIYEEVKRNGGKEQYDPGIAELNEFLKRKDYNENRPCPVSGNEKNLRFIERQLVKGLSPKAIVERVKLERKEKIICHQTIYNIINTSRKEWKKYLIYKGKRKDRKPNKNSEKIEKKSYHNRPLEANERSEIGHLEIDTIHLRGGGSLLSIVDRKSRWLKLYLLKDRKKVSVNECLIEFIRKGFFKGKVKSITCDNGKEFNGYKEIESRFSIPVYFCDPYASWQRGSNENANRIVRRYFPKSTSYKEISKKYLQEVETMINYLPRKILGYLASYESLKLKSVQLLI